MTQTAKRNELQNDLEKYRNDDSDENDEDLRDTLTKFGNDNLDDNLYRHAAGTLSRERASAF